MDRWLGFPVEVNERAARVVAAGVVLLAAAVVLTQSVVLLAILALGFAARVAAGPRYSLLGRLAAQVIAPMWGEPKVVPGAPKRFAQSVGLAFSGAALVAVAVFDSWSVATGILGVLIVFATLEATLGFCAGCFVFARLMAWGLVPQAICVECADITARQGVIAPLGVTSS